MLYTILKKPSMQNKFVCFFIYLGARVSLVEGKDCDVKIVNYWYSRAYHLLLYYLLLYDGVRFSNRAGIIANYRKAKIKSNSTEFLIRIANQVSGPINAERIVLLILTKWISFFSGCSRNSGTIVNDTAKTSNKIWQFGSK